MRRRSFEPMNRWGVQLPFRMVAEVCGMGVRRALALSFSTERRARLAASLKPAGRAQRQAADRFGAAVGGAIALPRPYGRQIRRPASRGRSEGLNAS